MTSTHLAVQRKRHRPGDEVKHATDDVSSRPFLAVAHDASAIRCCLCKRTATQSVSVKSSDTNVQTCTDGTIGVLTTAVPLSQVGSIEGP